MGTPEFAVATLDVLYHSKHCIKAVITAPDKPAGRGLKLQFSEVKQFALNNNIPILQPLKLKDPDFLEQLKEIEADLFVVVAFRMLPEEVFSMPPFGTINIHASLLPQFRGAAPIHWAVINGEKKTGVTSFFLNHEIDKGDIIDYKEISIEPTDTTGLVYDKLMMLGAQLALETVDKIQNKTAIPKPQQAYDISDLKPAPKLNKENTLINWNLPAQVVLNLIRGLSPYPGAYTHISTISGEKLIVKCLNAELSNQKSDGTPGTIITDNKTFLSICCSDFQISLLELQLQGKSKMQIQPFLLGFRKCSYTLFLF